MRATGNAERLGKTRQQCGQNRPSRKKGLTVAVSVLRLPSAEMQQMFHSTSSRPGKGHALGNLLRGIKGVFDGW